MTQPTTTQPGTLMVLVDWRSDFWEGAHTGLAGRMTCGCFSSPCHPGSSQWDFPGDVLRCDTHGEVQFDLRLQGLLYAQYSLPEDQWPEIPTEDQRLEARDDA